ncbi:hypothetical protein V1264_006969 [Littorina saxatilis]|uniref:Uncharacterized protein n=1 Tax=Littorina saxatilis TaxID=31220 RepID=A0AAN9G5L9_9CAEN
MHWNAEGVSNTKEELEHFLHENNINICCRQETHLQEGKPFKIRGYQVIRSDRQGKKKGGVMTLVPNNKNARETDRLMEEAEFITTGCKVCPKSGTLTLHGTTTTGTVLLSVRFAPNQEQ